MQDVSVLDDAPPERPAPKLQPWRSPTLTRSDTLALFALSGVLLSRFRSIDL